MGWFSAFKSKKIDDEHTTELPLQTTVVQSVDEIGHNPINSGSILDKQGIFLLYAYLQQDFEERGFNDALVSPDEGYKNDNIKLIKYDLEILIQQIKTYHDSLMKDLDFHILSRGRAGLIDLVEELKIKQTDLTSHIEKVEAFETSLQHGNGFWERAVLAYKRGFMKGMASITQAYLLSKKF
ncbi:hypothetical protein [Sphingobacterium sp. LRF_L2]|uniref:hypothetical protein n=1 Tax=Sphingobacterium sp. LRF_L2 TaxID=3369421 RepID=UPI003F646143